MTRTEANHPDHDTGENRLAIQARIFQEFQPVDTSSIRKTRETSLGLSIFKRIVERSSTFGFTSPVRVVRAVESA